MPYLYAVRMLIPSYEIQPIKIGYSTDPQRRRSTYNSGPYPCEFLGQWMCYSRDAETAIHRRFRTLKLTGEWFAPNEEFIGVVNSNIAQYQGMNQRAAEVLEQCAGRHG